MVSRLLELPFRVPAVCAQASTTRHSPPPSFPLGWPQQQQPRCQDSASWGGPHQGLGLSLTWEPSPVPHRPRPHTKGSCRQSGFPMETFVLKSCPQRCEGQSLPLRKLGMNTGYLHLTYIVSVKENLQVGKEKILRYMIGSPRTSWHAAGKNSI